MEPENLRPETGPQEAPDYIEMSDQFQQMVDEFFSVQIRYQAAMREVQARLENLDMEFQMKHYRNPIHHMESRMKSIQSIMKKLKRKQFPVSMTSAVENLYDLAGIRVVCSYIQDIYTVAGLLTSQDDIHLVHVHDYLSKPKQNGYRSLHLVIEVPVYLSGGKSMVPVEVQIRTIAMDFWATLEHNLRYKAEGVVTEEISRELLRAAEDIADVDERMQSIHDRMDALNLRELPEDLRPLPSFQREIPPSRKRM
ncbi:MAG: GTP pyrophosphokinase family protein [Clostridia bacterium]|nr:GTP pyrophosphokinase family protein [Clostridia bacterium]